MKRTGLSKKCAWCGLIKASEGWRTERRQEATSYSHGLCPDCLAAYFLTDLEFRQNWEGRQGMVAEPSTEM